MTLTPERITDLIKRLNLISDELNALSYELEDGEHAWVIDGIGMIACDIDDNEGALLNLIDDLTPSTPTPVGLNSASGGIVWVRDEGNECPCPALHYKPEGTDT